MESGDGSIVPGAPVYLGTLEIVGLFFSPIRIRVRGNGYIWVRSILDHFEITFGRGQRILVRP